MRKDSPIAAWIARRHPRYREPTDWADLGTAFGLEMSLTPPAGSDAAQPGATPSRISRALCWWQRLAARATAAVR